MFRDDAELCRYFPDQCLESDPPREYFFSVISSLRPQVFQQLLDEAEGSYWRRNEQRNQTIVMDQGIMQEIEGVNFRHSIMNRKSDKRVCLKQRERGFEDD